MLHEEAIEMEVEHSGADRLRALRLGLLEREPSLGRVRLVYENDRDTLRHRLLRLADAVAASKVALGQEDEHLGR